ncbi:MAG: ATP-binding protein [Bacilli bacterium]|nr:ATP-binding protein [Bacilli bacterium]
MKTLLILTGAPGSGKSTWAKQYQEEHENTFIISSDAIRMEITGSFNDHTQQPLVWETFSKRIHEYAQKGENITVILDALCDLNSLRIKYVQENPEYDEFVLAVFPRSFEFVKIHNKMRPEETWVPDDILEQLYAKYEKPSEEALSYFQKVLIIKE